MCFPPRSYLIPFLALAVLVGCSRQSQRLPNIVVILADDLGYGELGAQGNPEIPTPHIDSIAAAGVRFTSGYVTEPVCSPSRAGLITGRYQHRFGYDYNVMPHVPGGTADGLPHTESTLANYLKPLGYTSAIIGKWHLGAREDFNPVKRGFDYFFGFPHEGRYFVRPPYAGVATMLRMKPLPEGATGRWISPDGIVYHDLLGNEPLYDLHNPILRGLEEVSEERYLTDAFSDEAVQFIERNREKPFFLYLAYNAVHSPLQGANSYMERFAHIDDIQRRIFAAMLSNLDDGVGAVLQKLREHGLEKETLIFFLSDNGGPTLELTSSNLPLSGGKGQLLEGGIRIPFMASWEGIIPAGKRYDRPVISLDIFATAAAAAGSPVDAEKMDGVNLIPFITGERGGDPHQRLYWQRRGGVAIRAGDWKLVNIPGNSAEVASWRLYNLADDIAETTDLASQHPEKVVELREIAADFEREFASHQESR